MTCEIAFFWSSFNGIRSRLSGSAYELAGGRAESTTSSETPVAPLETLQSRTALTLEGHASQGDATTHGLLYYFVVRPGAQASGKSGAPPLGVFVAEGAAQTLVRHAQSAAAFESANPTGKGQLNAAVGEYSGR